MEDWKIVEMVRQYIEQLKAEGEIYATKDEAVNAIRWNRNNHDWLIIISVGKLGGLKGSLYIIDNTKHILAEQLAGNVKFNPYDPIDNSPFTHIGKNTGFFKWLNAQSRSTKLQSIKFVQEYLALLNKCFQAADDETLDSEIFQIKNALGPCVDPPAVFSGGAYGLGKR